MTRKNKINIGDTLQSISNVSISPSILIKLLIRGVYLDVIVFKIIQITKGRGGGEGGDEEEKSFYIHVIIRVNSVLNIGFRLL